MSELIYLLVVAFIFGVFFGGYIRPRLSKFLSSDRFKDPMNLTPIFDKKSK